MNCRNGAPLSFMSKDLFCFNRDFIGGGRGFLVKCFRTAPWFVQTKRVSV